VKSNVYIDDGSYSWLGGWIQAVLRSLLEPASPKLQALDVKYSTALEQDLMMSRYGVTSAVYMQLRHMFLEACGGVGLSRAELSLASWLGWVQGYVPVNIARIIFLSRVQSLKPVWRFSDFAEFVFLFGVGTVEDKLNSTVKFLLSGVKDHWAFVNVTETEVPLTNGKSCEISYSFGLKTIQQANDVTASVKAHACGNTLFYAMLLFLSQTTDVKPPYSSTAPDQTNLNDFTGSNVIGDFVGDSKPTESGTYRWLEDFVGSLNGIKLPSEVQQAVDETVENRGEDDEDSANDKITGSNHDSSDNNLTLSDYASIVIQFHRHFPVLKALSVIACCLFGLRPPTPSLEKEYIMELLVKHYNDVPHSNSNPYGPAGSQWCVVSKAWYETWQFYVGNSRVRQMYAIQREQEMMEKQLKKQRKRSRKKKNTDLLTATQQGTSLPRGGDGPASDISNSSLPLFRHYTEEDLPPEPGAIDNWSILNKSGPIQLLQNCVVGQHLELVPLSVYKALYCWYGGGPRIIRNVIVNAAGNNELELYPLCIKVCICDPDSGVADDSYKEYLFSKVATVHEVTQSLCDLLGFQKPDGGSPAPTVTSPTSPTSASRSTPVGFGDPSLTTGRIRGPLAQEGTVSTFDADAATYNARLWNLANPKVSEQYIISPELTVSKAGIEDGQVVLVELCVDGNWPRSHYQSSVCRENGEDNDWTHANNAENRDGEVLSGRDTIDGRGQSFISALWSNKRPSLYEASQNNSSLTRGSLVASPRDSLTPQKAQGTANQYNSFIRNDGKVGLDNLGNTCYLNSSLQALLHTEPLVEFFCKQYHIRDVNRRSKHGYGGRLSQAFGRLMYELWTAQQVGPPSNNNGDNSEVSSSTRNFRLRLRFPKGPHVSPKKFYADFTNIASQFRGHMQHDAQELLAFLLDGLSEDLNLVTEKPYIEYPDSNDRPDSELAEIWWKNHSLRDHSVIQTLFSGQFKSTISCECKYTSARFEPFMFLTLPLPEETTRPVVVYVMTVANPFALKCCARLARDATLNDVVSKLISCGVPGIQESSKFKAGEVINSKVVLLCSMNRRVGTIRDSDNIFLFEYLPLVSRTGTPVDEQAPALESSEPGMGAAAVKVVESDDAASTSSTNSEDEENTHSVPIAFVQRRAALHSGGGIKCYRMDSFGLPLVLTFKRDSTCREVYAQVNARVSKYLTAPIQDSLNACPGFAVAKSSDFDTDVTTAAQSEPNLRNDSGGSDDSFSAVISDGNRNKGIHSVLSEDVLAGNEIPVHGFVLRTITAHSSTNNICSRCPWLAACQGCLIPDDDTKISEFIGELTVLAIDWHVVIFEELLDTNIASDVRNHDTLVAEQNRSMVSGDIRIFHNQYLLPRWHRRLQKKCLPFHCCLDKFTEVEKIEDIMCPKCKTDTKMSKSLTLWRPPPILVVQLKRFQFDRQSRRKLHERVNHKYDSDRF
jgi:ubiquitin C-terminal hydrolase